MTTNPTPDEQAGDLSPEDREALHRVHAVPVNPTHIGCPICTLYVPVVARIRDDEAVARAKKLVAAFNREHDWRREAEAERDTARADLARALGVVAEVEALRDAWDAEARQAWADADRLHCGDIIADQITRRAERLRAVLGRAGDGAQ